VVIYEIHTQIATRNVQWPWPAQRNVVHTVTRLYTYVITLVLGLVRKTISANRPAEEDHVITIGCF